MFGKKMILLFFCLALLLTGCAAAVSNDAAIDFGGPQAQAPMDGGAVYGEVSAALLAALRPVARKHFTPKLAKTNVDAIVGSQGYVTAHVDNLSAQGQVKLGAMVWTARSTSGEPIEAGTLVRVDKIEGVKAFVSPAEVTTNV